MDATASSMESSGLGSDGFNRTSYHMRCQLVINAAEFEGKRDDLFHGSETIWEELSLAYKNRCSTLASRVVRPGLKSELKELADYLEVAWGRIEVSKQKKASEEAERARFEMELRAKAEAERARFRVFTEATSAEKFRAFAEAVGVRLEDLTFQDKMLLREQFVAEVKVVYL